MTNRDEKLSKVEPNDTQNSEDIILNLKTAPNDINFSKQKHKKKKRNTLAVAHTHGQSFSSKPPPGVKNFRQANI